MSKKVIEEDSFGIISESKILKSGVRGVFTPNMPIQDVQLFFGRQAEVRKIIEYLNTPGQHALLYGDRGVGKSSLANVIATLLLEFLFEKNIFKKRCDSKDRFATILADPLKNVGYSIHELESNDNTGWGISKSALNLTKYKSSRYTGTSARALSPSWVAQTIKDIQGLLVIDEFDAISSREEKLKISELIKHLSDEGSNFKILIVGIAESASELTSGHKSIQRCLKETRLTRMSEDELKKIISGGQERLGIEFQKDARDRIVKVSSGFPHFTHLLALKSAEDAILEDRKVITLKNVKDATKRAIEDAEGTLRKAYNDSIRSSSTGEYKKILLAAAICNEEEIFANALRSEYQKINGTSISQQTLNNHFQRLVSEDGSKILRRIAKGVYRFSDPRMASYIRIAQSYL